MGLSSNGTGSQSCVPPGFRFHPTDEELLYYYLKKKVSYEVIDLNVIRDVDLNKLEPWDLHERCKIGTAPQNEWYFFSHKDKKYPTGTRTNRATAAGFWKATGRDKAIYMNFKRIGMRKTLVFYTGRAPHGHKTEWIMHEYRLEDSEHPQPNEDGWVVCRVFKKRMHFKESNESQQLPTSSANEDEHRNDFPTGLPRSLSTNSSSAAAASAATDLQNLQSILYASNSHLPVNLQKPQQQFLHQNQLQYNGNLSSEMFAQMPQLHSPDAAVPSPAVLKNFMADDVLDMKISRRPSSFSIDINNNINFTHAHNPAHAHLHADVDDEDEEPAAKSSTQWSTLERLMAPHDHSRGHHDEDDHDHHPSRSQVHVSHSQPLDLASHHPSSLLTFQGSTGHGADFSHAHAHGIEYWNYEK